MTTPATTPAPTFTITLSLDEAEAFQAAAQRARWTDGKVAAFDAVTTKLDAAKAQNEARATVAAWCGSARKVVHFPNMFELHICRNVERFPARFGKKVKAMGGRYISIRGDVSKRYVHVPNTEAGRKLADEILAADTGVHGVEVKKTVIVRYGVHVSLPAPVVVHKVLRVQDALMRTAVAIEAARKAGRHADAFRVSA